MSTNPRRTIIAINGSGGAAVQISVETNGAVYAEIQEVPPAGYAGTPYTPQGLNYTLPDDNYTQVYSALPGAVIPFGNKEAAGRRRGGRGLGFKSRPAPYQGGSTIPATPYCQIISATATATQVQLTEWLP